MRLSWSRAGRVRRALWPGPRAYREPAWRWARLAGPYFGNAVSTLRLQNGSAVVTVEGTTVDGDLFKVATVPLRRS
jgi:hypothetical protein